MTEPVRLAKRLAEQLGCSRREAEQYIAGGWVRVDGAVVEEPQFRVQQQRIELDAQASLLELAPVTLVLHKPAGFEAGFDEGAGGAARSSSLLLPSSRWHGDRADLRPLKKHFSAIEMVSPLATAASGLVVFTQDFRIARKLREDAGVMEHEVLVETSGTIRPGGLERLNRIDHGFTFNGAALPPTKASWQSENRLRFAVKGERPGQLAYLCESVGLSALAMKRIRIGRLPMSQLPAGQWRYLLPHERF